MIATIAHIAIIEKERGLGFKSLLISISLINRFEIVLTTYVPLTPVASTEHTLPLSPQELLTPGQTKPG
jgi:hypothetical protein